MALINLDDIAVTMTGDMEKAARQIKIVLFTGVVTDTRVDLGRLRGNWQASQGAMKTNEIERLDKTGAQVLTEIKQVVSSDSIDYLTNNVPYAAHWEERDGMIAKNIARLERVVKGVESK